MISYIFDTEFHLLLWTEWTVTFTSFGRDRFGNSLCITSENHLYCNYPNPTGNGGGINMKKKLNHAFNYITAILIFICAMTVSLSIFLVKVQNSIDTNSQNIMTSTVSHQSDRYCFKTKWPYSFHSSDSLWISEQYCWQNGEIIFSSVWR